jgi:hypothetical protein
VTFARCTDCPIAGPCIHDWTGHAPYCDWARRGGRLLERVRELSAEGPPGSNTAQSRPTVTVAGVTGLRAIAVDYAGGSGPCGGCPGLGV